MANIKVHILNFHGLNSHIELVLENTSTNPHTFYGINRWSRPAEDWVKGGPGSYIRFASEVYSFDIKADPQEITREWTHHWEKTLDDAGILSHNCAVSAQWFLNKYAHIPNPDLSNLSINHVMFGIQWPSIVPFPVTLPGRIFANAKFHMEMKLHPEKMTQYSKLFLYCAMAISGLLFLTGVLAIAAAAIFLTGGIAAVPIIAGVAACYLGTRGFFNEYNKLSMQNMLEAQIPESLPLKLA